MMKSFEPKANSKTQKAKKEEAKTKKIRYIACKNCHSTNVTLIRGKDSYYCKFCYDKMNKARIGGTKN